MADNWGTAKDPQRRFQGQRFGRLLWPKRLRVGELDEINLHPDPPDDFVHGTRLVDLAYTAAADRLTEQRARLEGLRDRAGKLLSIAALLATFSSSIGLFGTDTTKGVLTLPFWCLCALAGVLLALGLCTWHAIRPTPPSWMHGPPSEQILKAAARSSAEQADDKAVKAAATRAMNHYVEVNGSHLDFCGWWYRIGGMLLGIELLLIIAGVITQQDTHPAEQKPKSMRAVTAVQHVASKRYDWPVQP